MLSKVPLQVRTSTCKVMVYSVYSR